MKNLEVTIFSRGFEPIGALNKMTALRWTERANDFGDFELWCPLTIENAELLKKENLVWIGTDSIGVIEVIVKTKSEDGNGLHISGRFNESWLERRIVWHKYSETDAVSNHMRNLVYSEAINPIEPERKIPNLALTENQAVLGPSVSLGSNMDNLWKMINDLGTVHNLSPRLVNKVKEKKCYFTVFSGADRSVEQNNNPKIALSSDLSDILSSEYTSDSSGCKSTALVAGAGEGVDRKTYTVGQEFSGLNRREMFVDARDLSDTEGDGEEETPIDSEKYDAMLKERGKSYLAENRAVESFTAQIRMEGIRAYTYGEDYFLGDIVTVQDKELAIQSSTKITGVTQTWDNDGYSVELSLGVSAPTIKQFIMKRG